MKNQSGMSLMELLIALAVAGILLGFGVPSFVQSKRNSDMVTSSNAIVAALYSARSEAVKTQNRVTMCPGDMSTATPACAAEGRDLLVFTNTADDATFDPGAGDTMLRADAWLTDSMTVTTTAGFPPYVTFTREGFTRQIGGGSITGSLLLCGPSAEILARVISVSATGRPTVKKHAAATTTLSCPVA